MLAFISAVIKLVIKLFFVDRLAKENEELRKENQRLKEENQELAREKAEGIQNHFSLFQKYLVLNQRNEELTKQLHRYSSGVGFRKSGIGINYIRHPEQSEHDINQEFNSDDVDIIDRLLEEFNLSDNLTI